MCKIADVIVLALLAICGVSDWKKKTIPILYLLILSVTVVISSFLCTDVSIEHRIGGVLLGIFFLIVSKCTREAIGYGDSWLILFLGLQLGYLQAIGVLFVASMFAAVASLFFLWRCRWRRNSTLPFVPFLTIAYLAVVVL